MNKRNNRIAIFLGHPAHFHMFKHTVTALEKKSIEVDYVIKSKDIVEDLVKMSGHKYYVVRKHERRASGKLALAISLIEMELRMIRYILKRKPKLIVGTYAPVLSHLTGVPFIVCCEDDTAIIPRFAKTSYPYAKAILAPIYCNGGKWNNKMTKYAGFQKLAYLHPRYFTADRSIIEPNLRHKERPYVLIRFAKLEAHHDEGIKGMTNQLALQLIHMLSDTYDIYISSERPLDTSLEDYRLHINPMDIHHWLAFASIYIGDSQSMSVEAAMLGVPSVRFSDFAGRIGVLNALEERYHLTTGIPSTQPQKLIETIEELTQTPNLKDVYATRREKMLAEQIDVSQFFTDYIVNSLCTTSQ